VVNQDQDDGYKSDIEVSEAGATIGSDRQAVEQENMFAEDPLYKKYEEQISQVHPEPQAAEELQDAPPQLVKHSSKVGADGLNESFGEEEWEPQTHRCSDLVFKITL
jgi:hypothetical protein